jgi:hypothetical protein
MIRDPRDRYASSQTRWKLRRSGVGGGTAEWLGSARLAIRNEQRFSDRYRVIRYEDLATEPERSLAEICEFVGERFEPVMLAMEGAPRLLEQGSNSSYGRRRSGVIATDSIGRFRQVLTPRQIAFVERLAGNEMAHFDYARESVRLPPATRIWFTVATVPLETARSTAWRARDARMHRAGRPVPSYRLVHESAAP